MCLVHIPLESQGLRLGDPFDPDLLADQLEQHPGFQVVIPGVQGPHPRGLAHPVPVLGHPGHDDGTAVGWGEAPVASHDLEAGRQPLDIPFPRARQRLVEVVDVEDHAPVGRRKAAEVAQVRVAA